MWWSATKAEYAAEIRKLVPNNFLLVPGLVPRRELAEVCRYGLTRNHRTSGEFFQGIIYASNGTGLCHVAATAARELQQQMQDILDRR